MSIFNSDVEIDFDSTLHDSDLLDKVVFEFNQIKPTPTLSLVSYRISKAADEMFIIRPAFYFRAGWYYGSFAKTDEKIVISVKPFPPLILQVFVGFAIVMFLLLGFNEIVPSIVISAFIIFSIICKTLKAKSIAETLKTILCDLRE